MPQESQIDRLICVEGWRATGQWSGVPLRHFLKAVNADTRARYVALHRADSYFESIDMGSALHPQTILALDFLGAPQDIIRGQGECRERREWQDSPARPRPIERYSTCRSITSELPVFYHGWQSTVAIGRTSLPGLIGRVDRGVIRPPGQGRRIGP